MNAICCSLFVPLDATKFIYFFMSLLLDFRT